MIELFGLGMLGVGAGFTFGAFFGFISGFRMGKEMGEELMQAEEDWLA